MIRRLTCPICKKVLPPDGAATLKSFPFCSERCRLVDFHRWSEGKYAIVEPLSPEALAERLEQDQAADDAAAEEE